MRGSPTRRGLHFAQTRSADLILKRLMLPAGAWSRPPDQATIDDDVGSGDIVGRVADQERSHSRKIVRRADAAGGIPRSTMVALSTNWEACRMPLAFFGPRRDPALNQGLRESAIAAGSGSYKLMFTNVTA